MCVYQDLVLGGKVAVRGRRDCTERWELIAPHLPASGAVLDVGSNLGWFALRLCEQFPRVVVASIEADPRSAALQRVALAAAAHQRIALLTAPASVRLVRTFALRGQRFAAVLCLSVLHWLPRHREFLTLLGRISDRLLIEHPDPGEQGAGHDHLRREIGPIGPYLESLFPRRPVICLGNTLGYRSPSHPRSMWLVGPPSSYHETCGAEFNSSRLDVRSLLAGGLSWPPRSWWHSQVRQLGPGSGASGGEQALWLTWRGLQGSVAGLSRMLLWHRLWGIPERAVFPWPVRLRHCARAARRRMLALTCRGA